MRGLLSWREGKIKIIHLDYLPVMPPSIDDLRKIILSMPKVGIEKTDSNITIRCILGVRVSLKGLIVESFEYERTPELEALLQEEEIQRHIFQPSMYGILLVDIVGYSKFPTIGQAALLAILQQTIESAKMGLAVGARGKIIEQIIPTGDGCYIIFDKSLTKRFLRFASVLLSGLRINQEDLLEEAEIPINADDTIKILIAGCLGELDFFTDLAGNRNCFGIGMNEAARILTCGKDALLKRGRTQEEINNTVFIHENILEQAQFMEYALKKLQIPNEFSIENLGILEDKHTMTRRVYWVNNFPKHAVLSLYAWGEEVDKS